MEKKNLEQLFRDRFKNFQETPDDRVWKSIEASLEKKKKKRVIPLWWQLGGAAALFAILFYTVNPFADNTPLEQNTLTETEQKKQLDSKIQQNDFQENIDSSSTIPETNKLAETNSLQEEQTIEQNDGQHQNNKVVREAYIPAFQGQKDGQFATNNTSKNQVNKGEIKNVLGVESSQDSEEAVAQVNEKSQENLDNKNPNLFNPKNGEKGNSIEETLVENTEETEKKSIFEAIEEQDEEEIVAADSGGKWSVATAVAPVFFNGIGEGSPVHPNFSSNSKSGNINLSYGLNVAYELNKKLSVRTGVHRVNYGYNTNDIVFSSSLNSSTNQDIDNIDYNSTSRGLVVESAVASAAEINQSSTADFVTRTPEFEGRMVQRLGYMEVPLELNYTLVDKKFGVNLIGGMSSLFLVDNSVSLETDGLVTEIGEANNVNNVNFSTNIGLGLNYKFSDKIQANVEPVFKYQLNTFSNTGGDFRPFAVGVYSGLSFKF